MTFETGLATHGANDVALTVSNDGATYARFTRARRAGWNDYARAAISVACRRYGLAEYGRSYLNDHDSVVEYVWNAWTGDDLAVAG